MVIKILYVIKKFFFGDFNKNYIEKVFKIWKDERNGF